MNTKRYVYIIIGIVVAAVIVIVALLLIKGHTAAPSIGGASTTTTGGSLPVVGTQEGQSNAGTSTSESGTVGALGLPPITSSTPGTSVTGQQTAVQSFGVLSDNPVLDYFIDPENNITAIEPTGEVFTVSNGQSTVVNSSTISNIISASFSYDGKKILVNYGDPNDPQSGIFTVATNAWVALPQGILSPQWSPTSNYQIAYLATTNSGSLALATIDAANLKANPVTIYTLSASDLSLQWPQKSEFILSDKPSSKIPGSIWIFNSQADTFTSVAYEIAGAESTWSNSVAFPYGLVFTNATQDQLQLESLSGTPTPQTLTFLTLPSKCTFNPERMPIATSTPPSTATSTVSTTTPTTKKAVVVSKFAATSTPYLAIYCGVPRSSSGFSSANLPDDYNMMALFTSDDIVKINTASDTAQSLWSDPTQNMDVSDIKFFNNAIFFVNRYDQKLYGLTFSSN